jgi:hypothetical protein
MAKPEQNLSILERRRLIAYMTCYCKGGLVAAMTQREKHGLLFVRWLVNTGRLSGDNAQYQ